MNEPETPEETPRFQILPLTRGQERSGFDGGVPAMNEFLQRYALQNEENHLSRTWVCLVEGTGQIAGYYTTSWSTVQFTEIPQRGMPKRYPFQVGLIAQLAVDLRFQGRGLGGVLLLDALSRFEQLDRINPIPAVVLDLRASSLRAFYERYGFVSCGESAPERMYLMMKTIKQMGMTDSV